MSRMTEQKSSKLIGRSLVRRDWRSDKLNLSESRSCNLSIKYCPFFKQKQFFIYYYYLTPEPIDYAKHVIQGLQEGYPGWNNQHNSHLVFWSLPVRELTSLGHEYSALTTRPWLIIDQTFKKYSFNFNHLILIMCTLIKWTNVTTKVVYANQIPIFLFSFINRIH